MNKLSNGIHINNNSVEFLIFSYQTSGDGVEVLVREGTVWLSQKNMGQLFDTSTDNVGLHLKKIFREEELEANSVTEEFSVTASDGKNYKVKHYNLDAIIAVGYRVNSKRATVFRQWATNVLREYLLRGYAVNQRVENLEHRMDGVEKQIGFFVKNALPPVEGIFYEGQIFDAYEFASRLVKSAKKRIVLVDNYIDETVLGLLAKRKDAVSAFIYTSRITNALQADINSHNMQYPHIDVDTVSGVHDRFLIIDDTIYHIGASIKDLGKKLFAFSKMEMPPDEILQKLA